MAQSDLEGTAMPILQLEQERPLARIQRSVTALQFVQPFLIRRLYVAFESFSCPATLVLNDDPELTWC